MLRILSFSLTFIIFLSMACWFVSNFFTNTFVRNHVRYPYAIAGMTNWLKAFLYRLMERCLSRNISLYFPKNTPSCFYSYRDFLPCSIFHCCCLSQLFIVSHLLYFCPVHLYVVCCVTICSKFSFSFMYLETNL